MKSVKISENLKELRKEHNYTQKYVAEQLGISTTCYAGYEQDYREPDLEILRKICLFYQVSADILLNLETEDGRKIYNQNYYENITVNNK